MTPRDVVIRFFFLNSDNTLSINYWLELNPFLKQCRFCIAVYFINTTNVEDFRKKNPNFFYISCCICDIYVLRM